MLQKKFLALGVLSLLFPVTAALAKHHVVHPSSSAGSAGSSSLSSAASAGSSMSSSSSSSVKEKLSRRTASHAKGKWGPKKGTSSAGRMSHSSRSSHSAK